jgi:hypothetical protein
MRCRPVRFLVWLVCMLLAVACASQRFDGRVYQNDGLHFRVGPIPAAWRRIDADYALLAFRDDPASSTIAVNARCGVDGDDVPLSALTQHLFLEFTDRAQVSQAPLTLAGREALRTELSAALDGVRKRYLVYVLKKDGCVYDFMHIAADDSVPGDRPDFERFVQGFATIE